MFFCSQEISDVARDPTSHNRAYIALAKVNCSYFGFILYLFFSLVMYDRSSQCMRTSTKAVDP